MKTEEKKYKFTAVDMDGNAALLGLDEVLEGPLDECWNDKMYALVCEGYKVAGKIFWDEAAPEEKYTFETFEQETINREEIKALIQNGWNGGYHIAVETEHSYQTPEYFSKGPEVLDYALDDTFKAAENVVAEFPNLTNKENVLKLADYIHSSLEDTQVMNWIKEHDEDGWGAPINAEFIQLLEKLEQEATLNTVGIDEIATNYDTVAARIGGQEYIVIPDYEDNAIFAYRLPSGGADKIAGLLTLPEDAEEVEIANITPNMDDCATADEVYNKCENILKEIHVEQADKAEKDEREPSRDTEEKPSIREQLKTANTDKTDNDKATRANEEKPSIRAQLAGGKEQLARENKDKPAPQNLETKRKSNDMEI